MGKLSKDQAGEVYMEKTGLAKKTRQELMEIAKETGLVGRSRMTKDELVSSLAKAVKVKKPVAAKKKLETAKVPIKKKAKGVEPAPAGRVGSLQEKVEDTRFYLGAEEKAFITDEELPAGYGDNKVVLMVRDPHWAYVYWEINSRKIAEARSRLKSAFDQSSLVLRVYDVTGIDFDGKNAHSFFDINIPNVLGNWYVNLGRPNRSFCIDIGYKERNGNIFVLSRSNKVTSPRDIFSDVMDEEWITSEEAYKTIYARSFGLGAAGASAELAEMMKGRHAGEISSPGMRWPGSKETKH